MELLDSSCNVTSPWLPVPIAKLWLYYNTYLCILCNKKTPKAGFFFRNFSQALAFPEGSCTGAAIGNATAAGLH